MILKSDLKKSLYTQDVQVFGFLEKV